MGSGTMSCAVSLLSFADKNSMCLAYFTPCNFCTIWNEPSGLLMKFVNALRVIPVQSLHCVASCHLRAHHAAVGGLLLQVRREEVRQQMLKQFKQSMAAPAWELEDYEWSDVS